MSIRHLLVPVDFSPGSDLAFDHAVALAKVFDADVHVLHVFQVPTYALPDGAFIPGADAVAEILTSAEKEVHSRVERAASSGVRFHAHTTEGAVDQEILRVAGRTHADMVVMGTHGRTGLRKVLLGSVAERVVRAATMPVITVRAGDEKVTTAHRVSVPPARITVAFDFSAPSRHALQMAKDIQDKTGAAIDVVHVFADPWAEYRTASPSFKETAENRFAAYKSGLATMLDKAIEECFPDRSKVTKYLLSGSTVDEVLALAVSTRSDLVCLGVSGKDAVERLLLGSSTSKTVQASEVPVLTVH